MFYNDFCICVILVVQPCLFILLLCFFFKMNIYIFYWFKIGNWLKQKTKTLKFYECAVFSKFSNFYKFDCSYLIFCIMFLFYDIDIIFFISEVVFIYFWSFENVFICLIWFFLCFFCVIYDYKKNYFYLTFL